MPFCFAYNGRKFISECFSKLLDKPYAKHKAVKSGHSCMESSRYSAAFTGGRSKRRKQFACSGIQGLPLLPYVLQCFFLQNTDFVQCAGEIAFRIHASLLLTVPE